MGGILSTKTELTFHQVAEMAKSFGCLHPKDLQNISMGIYEHNYKGSDTYNPFSIKAASEEEFKAYGLDLKELKKLADVWYTVVDNIQNGKELNQQELNQLINVLKFNAKFIMVSNPYNQPDFAALVTRSMQLYNIELSDIEFANEDFEQIKKMPGYQPQLWAIGGS